MFKFLKRKTILDRMCAELRETELALLQNERDAETVKGRKVKYTARKARLQAAIDERSGVTHDHRGVLWIPAPQVPCGCDASEADECPDNLNNIGRDTAGEKLALNQWLATRQAK